ncbi:hypothetical protein OK23_001174 [Salmonella enterica subsp. enterica]|nr:hypothetical protein [Salmonella enterica subsp. enterica]EDV3363606.1 hypothetical protein [Salmonella enterica subsp. enterica]
MELPAAACSILALVSTRSLALSLSIREFPLQAEQIAGWRLRLIWPVLRVSPHNKCHAAFSFDTSKLTIACFSSGF